MRNASLQADYNRLKRLKLRLKRPLQGRGSRSFFRYTFFLQPAMHASQPSTQHTAYRTNDVAWPAQFHHEITPRSLTATATAVGAAAPDVDRAPFVWLELGCGAGLNALVTAACHPRSRVVAIDLNPREIERAQRIAGQAGLDNVQFICADLACIDPASLPRADFIVSMGTYSWAGEAARQGIDTIVGQRLNTGGIACIGYMSQPGAAAFASARALMLQIAAQTPGDSAAQATAGIEVLRNLAAAGAGFFVDHPAIARAVGVDAQAVGAASLAHELLNPDWRPLHVADVMARLHGHDCRFIGSASPLDNIDALSLPAHTAAVIAQLAASGANPATLETARDLARNQRQRRDLFQKHSTAPLSPDAHRAALLTQRVRLAPSHARQRAQRQGDNWILDTPIGAATVAHSHIQPLLAALHNGPHSYAQIAALSAYSKNPGFINQIFQILHWAEIIYFVAATPQNPTAQIHALEASLSQNNLGHWQIIPDAGSAIPITRNHSPAF